MKLVVLKEYGRVERVQQSIVKVSGFSFCALGGLVKFGYGTLGLIVGFKEDEAAVLLLKEKEKIRRGDKAFSCVDEEFKIGVGESYLGRAVSALGEPLDGKGAIKPQNYYPLFGEAASVLERVPINEVFETGIKIIDMLIPLGCGQRELIAGDRVTGKTSIATDTILHQKDKGVVCIYCFIGKTERDLSKVIELFKEGGAFDYTIVVAASAAVTAGQQYIVPYAAASLGEYFMNQGRKVLVVFDDLTKHAWIWRQISLLLERFPGRDAYPGDIFYIHSQLMERAAKLSPEMGGGAMTFLPIAQTIDGDITGYIPSNLISMTDGQIYLAAPLFYEGFRPAVDLGLSVSRIGNKIQWPAIRELAAGLRLEYLQYRQAEQLTKMNARLSEEVEIRLKKGRLLCELLKQEIHSPVSLSEQVVLFYAYRKGCWDNLSLEKAQADRIEIFERMQRRDPQLIKEIEDKKELTAEIKMKLDNILKDFGNP
ncbi:MAG: F0F1 ATP synthase subunit alpha [Candidatus Omnitrophica bacterium]|nr:F0F1 ATP synthase subunit alpha [Candidatus Omnitrophota bacterium]